MRHHDHHNCGHELSEGENPFILYKEGFALEDGWYTKEQNGNKIKAPAMESPYDTVVQNMATGQQISFSGITKGLIGAYGFYGGDIPRRLSPNSIIKLFSNSDPGIDRHSPRQLKAITPDSLRSAVKARQSRAELDNFDSGDEDYEDYEF